MKYTFRGSEITDFQRCPKRYNYGWIQNLEPKVQNEKLTLGSAIHKFLETWYMSRRFKEAIEEMRNYIDDVVMNSDMEQVVIDEMIELAQGICLNYHRTYGDDSNWTVLAVEKQFNVEFDDGTVYTGTIDLIVEDEDGHVWFVDHKTTISLDIYDKNSDMDRQISRYWWALEQLGYNVHGFIYNIVLKDVPVEPKVLKSGALSKDKSQKTTFELYMKAIEDNNLKVSDYEDFLQQLKDYPKEFFRRLKVERTPQECQAAIGEMLEVIEDIRDKHNNWRWYRNITKDCHWDCAFKSLCQAEMDGSNADHIRAELFRVKEDLQ